MASTGLGFTWRPISTRCPTDSVSDVTVFRALLPCVVLSLACEGLLSGCLPRVGEPIDGGLTDEVDAGDTKPDGGELDAGTCFDGVRGPKESDVDCGGACTACPVLATCLGPVDCQSLVCVAGHCTAPVRPCNGSFAGCSASNVVDLTTSPAPTIHFPNGNQTYSPRCLRIKLGQSVTFSGNFSGHPLAQACGPTRVVSATSGNSATFGFTEGLGSYGFYCEMHGSSTGAGMTGAIEVVR